MTTYITNATPDSRSPTCHGGVSEGLLPTLARRQGAYSTTQESGPERARSKHASCRSAGDTKIGQDEWNDIGCGLSHSLPDAASGFLDTAPDARKEEFRHSGHRVDAVEFVPHDELVGVQPHLPHLVEQHVLDLGIGVQDLHGNDGLPLCRMDKVDVTMASVLGQLLSLLVHGTNANWRKFMVL